MPVRPWPATYIGAVLALIGVVLAILMIAGTFPFTQTTVGVLFCLAFLAILL